MKGAAWSWKSAASDVVEKRDGGEARRGLKLETETAPESSDKGEPEQDPDEKSEPERETASSLRIVEPVRAEEDVKTAVEEAENDSTEAEKEEKPEAAGGEEGGSVVNVNFPRAARGWDIWELSELVEETPGQDPARQEERRQILYHLREHTSVDGRIPSEFESLIYDAFGELIPDNSGA